MLIQYGGEINEYHLSYCFRRPKALIFLIQYARPEVIQIVMTWAFYDGKYTALLNLIKHSGIVPDDEDILNDPIYLMMLDNKALSNQLEVMKLEMQKLRDEITYLDNLNMELKEEILELQLRPKGELYYRAKFEYEQAQKARELNDLE